MPNQAWIETKVKVNTTDLKRGFNEAKQEAKNLQQSLENTGKAGNAGATKFRKTFASKIKEGRGDLVFLGSFIGTTLGQSAGKTFGETFNSIMSGAIGGLFAGQFLGPWGTVIGALLGGGIGAYSAIQGKRNAQQEELQNLAKTFNTSTEAISRFIERVEKLGYSKDIIKDVLNGDSYKQAMSTIQTTFLADQLGLADILGARKDTARQEYIQLMARAARARSRMPDPKKQTVLLKEADVQTALAKLSPADLVGATKAIESLGGLQAFVVRINESLNTNLMDESVFKPQFFRTTPYDTGINTRQSVEADLKAIEDNMRAQKELTYDALQDEEKILQLVRDRQKVEEDIANLRYGGMTTLAESRLLSDWETKKLKLDNLLNALEKSVTDKRDSLLQQQSTLEERLVKTRVLAEDRNRLTLGELANADVYTRRGAINRAKAREASIAESYAKQWMVEGRGDLATQWQNMADQIRQSIDGLTSAERNPMQAILAEEAKAVEELKSVNANLITIQKTTGAMR